MDILYLVVFGLLLFGIPELMRSKKRKYEYPEIPDPEQMMHRPPLTYQGKAKYAYADPDTGEGKSMEWDETSDADSVATPVAVLTQMAEANPWNGKLTLPQVLNGVVFSEILQPPRAKRPAGRYRHG